MSGEEDRGSRTSPDRSKIRSSTERASSTRVLVYSQILPLFLAL